MTIAANSYAEFVHTLRGNAPIVGATRTIETPSVEPTLDGYVGFCTNSRDQFNNFCLLIGHPELVDGDFANFVERQNRWKEWNDLVHEWTTQHTTAEIVQLASELRIPVAPVLNGENIFDCDHFIARRVFVDDPTGFVQDAASPVAHGRRRPSAAAVRRLGSASTRGRSNRACRLGRPSPTVPRRCRWRVYACSTSPRGGRGRSPPAPSPRSAPT